MNTPAKPWYKKKRYYVIFGILITFINALAGPDVSTPTPYVQGSNYVTESVVEKKIDQPQVLYANESIVEKKIEQQPVSEVKKATVPKDTNNVGLSNSNYYTNTSGNTVHSPAYSEDSSVPAGASAQCGDGTYSFSQSRRGTCSHHGGVATWF